MPVALDERRRAGALRHGRRGRRARAPGARTRSRAARRSTASAARSASGAALRAVLGARGDARCRQQAEADGRRATRASSGCSSQAPRLDATRGEKTLVFVAHRETLEMLRTALSHRAQLATGVFHEELSPARRDIEVAQFREPGGPEPARLDRVRRRGPQLRVLPPPRAVRPAVEPVGGRAAHRPARPHRPAHARSRSSTSARPAASARTSVRLLRGARPLPRAAGRPGAAARARGGRARAVAARAGGASLSDERVRGAGRRGPARRARASARPRTSSCTATRYRPEMAAGILARVPADLDALNQDVVVAACERLGLRRRAPRAAGASSRSSFGNEALVDSLPGVPGGSSFVGTFDREEAVEDETLDFFASGHPLGRGRARALRGRRRSGRVARFERRDRAGARCRAWWPSTRTGRRSRWSRWTPPGRPGRTGRRPSAGGRSARAASATTARRSCRARRTRGLEDAGAPVGCSTRTVAPSARARRHRGAPRTERRFGRPTR